MIELTKKAGASLPQPSCSYRCLPVHPWSVRKLSGHLTRKDGFGSRHAAIICWLVDLRRVVRKIRVFLIGSRQPVEFFLDGGDNIWRRVAFLNKSVIQGCYLVGVCTPSRNLGAKHCIQAFSPVRCVQSPKLILPSRIQFWRFEAIRGT